MRILVPESVKASGNQQDLQISQNYLTDTHFRKNKHHFMLFLKLAIRNSRMEKNYTFFCRCFSCIRVITW